MRPSIRRWYADPALVEVVFDIHAAPEQERPWSDEQQARMVARMVGFQTHESLALDASLVRLDAEPGTPPPNQSGERACRWNSDHNRAVQFGAGVCAYNVAPPYGHYEDHLPPFRRLLTHYLAISGLGPTVFAGQRYINRFHLHRDDRPTDLFCFYPPLPERFMAQHVPLSLKLETAAFRGGATTVELTRREDKGGEFVYVVEVYSRATEPIAAEADAILAWHQVAHVGINESFEMAITAECRKRMREI